MSSTNVSIIILNWNGWKDTIECLESLYQIAYPNSGAFSVNALPRRAKKGCYDVIVVDNGSEDESIEKIREYCEGKIRVESKFFEYSSENKPIKIIEYTREEAEAGGGKEKEIDDLPSNRKLILIKNEKNYGFAEGNNIGIRYALSTKVDYVLLLNNDTVVDRGFLEELVKVAESNEGIGIVGPKIYYYDEPTLIQSAGVKIDLWLGEFSMIGWKKNDDGQFDKVMDVDSASGCTMLIKKELILKIFFLDTNYFLYFEDTEFCIRAKRSGYTIIYVPQSKIWHKSSISAKKTSGIGEYYSARNRFWCMKRHATRRQYLSFLIYFFVFRFWFISGIHIVYHQNINAFISFFRGVRDGIKGVPQ